MGETARQGVNSLFSFSPFCPFLPNWNPGQHRCHIASLYPLGLEKLLPTAMADLKYYSLLKSYCHFAKPN